MAESPSIIDEYAEQADDLVRLLADSSSEALAWRPDPSRRSITEIVARLADAELMASLSLRRIITRDRPRLDGYDQEAWAQRLDYARQEVEQSALVFTALRRANTALLGQLSYEDWGLTGHHAEKGEVSLFQLVEEHIADTAQRLRQVRAVTAEFAAQTNGHTVPAPGARMPEAEAVGGAKFYALALFAGLTILTVGFFMQSSPVYLLGGLLSAAGVLFVLLAMLNKNRPT